MEQGLELQTVWVVAIAVLSVVVAALLGYVAVLSRRLDNLTKKYEFFMQDSDGKSQRQTGIRNLLGENLGHDHQD